MELFCFSERVSFIDYEDVVEDSKYPFRAFDDYRFFLKSFRRF